MPIMEVEWLYGILLGTNHTVYQSLLEVRGVVLSHVLQVECSFLGCKGSFSLSPAVL